MLDPDIAVKQLEAMADLLGQLSQSEQEQLVNFTEAEAGRVLSPEYREFLRACPETVVSEGETLAEHPGR